MYSTIEAKKIPILMYHSISRTDNKKFLPFAVPAEEFSAQMDYLYQRHYHPMTVTQFIQVRAAKTLPERPIVITFDDGFADFLLQALPVLQRYTFPATLYITTAFVGSTSRWLRREGEGMRPMLTWSQVRELCQAGIECGGHTQHHPQLDLLPLAQARTEIRLCKTELEQQTGQEVTSFAYPFGYYTPMVKRLVYEAGYTSACAVKHALSLEASDPLQLARLMVSPHMALPAFEQLLTGSGVSGARSLILRARTPLWRIVRHTSSFVTHRSTA